MDPRLGKCVSVGLGLLLILLFPISWSWASDTVSARVVRVVDGDTLDVRIGGRVERVRLIGVDTPEVHESEKLYRDAERSGRDVETIRALGARASEFVKGLVHPGDTVTLEFDWQRRGKYGRLLAYVYLPDGRMLNEVIICSGYGMAYTRFPFRQDLMDRFLACQRKARAKGLGLWAEANLAPSMPAPGEALGGPVHANRRSHIYHLPGCPHYNRISPRNLVIFQSEKEAMAAGYRKARNCP